jgi:hypothetical protein
VLPRPPVGDAENVKAERRHPCLQGVQCWLPYGCRKPWAGLRSCQAGSNHTILVFIFFAGSHGLSALDLCSCTASKPSLFDWLPAQGVVVHKPPLCCSSFYALAGGQTGLGRVDGVDVMSEIDSALLMELPSHVDDRQTDDE